MSARKMLDGSGVGELGVEVARAAVGEAVEQLARRGCGPSGASFSISRGTNCGLRMRR